MPVLIVVQLICLFRTGGAWIFPAEFVRRGGGDGTSSSSRPVPDLPSRYSTAPVKEICTIIIIVRRSEFFRMPVSSYVPGKEQDSLHQDLEPIATF